MDVAVIGASMTAFGEHDAWIRGLLASAATACLEDAAVAPSAVSCCRSTLTGHDAVIPETQLVPLISVGKYRFSTLFYNIN